jgi:hypothetical protein
MTTVRFLNQSANMTITPPGAARNMTPEIFSITPTQIIGSVEIPYNATLNLWKINVTTIDGGEVSGAGKFTVIALPAPTFTTVSPASGAAGTTVPFSISGDFFQPRGGTTVKFINTTVYRANIISVSPKLITGTFTIPGGAIVGPYAVNVSTVEGGFKNQTAAFRVV